ncbi:MAG TPA: PKD domain-containing protein, partial [Anaeromyxobacteraceae bacterium]
LPGATAVCSDPIFKKTLGQPCAVVDLFAIDINACTGATTDRPWGAIDVDPGPPTGVSPGRWRFRPPNTILSGPPSGAFDPPPQQMHAVQRGATVVKTKNGLLAGQYAAPITEYLFPENGATGTPLVPNNFGSFPFLVNGLGPLGGFGSGGPHIGQLTPWPEAVTPAAASCGVVALTPPTANPGPAQTVASGATVVLDGSGSTDPNGLALSYAWTQTAGTPMTLNSTTAQSPTFTAPIIPAGQASGVLSFSLTVTDTAGQVSSPATVSITVTPQQAITLPPTASAGANLVVAAGSNVVLSGTATDPNAPPLALTAAWTQTSGLPLVTLTNANTLTPSFKAPALAAGTVLGFTLVVTNSATLQATSAVTVTVLPVAAPFANAGPNQTVPLQAPALTVHLTGVGSSDPNGLPLTYAWAQVSGVAQGLTGATTPTPSFTAGTAGTFGFVLTVNNGFLTSTALVTVTVTPAADQVTILTVVYRVSKQRLDVTATSSNPNAILTLKGFNGGPDQLFQPGAGGVPTVILIGVGEPLSVTVVSNLGGTATSPVTRVR